MTVMITLDLRKKILVLSIGTLVLFAVAILVLVTTVLSEKIVAELEKRGVAIAGTLAEQSANYILTDKIMNLQMLTNDYSSSQKDIEYIFILNEYGEILTNTITGGVPTDLKEANHVPRGATSGIQPVTIGGKVSLDIAVPIMNGDLGTVRLGISETAVKKSVTDVIKFVILITTILLLLVSAASIVWGRRLTRPLGELVEAVQAVGAGDLARKVEVHGKDEIGRLGIVFNKMISDLSQTLVSKHYVDNIINSMADLLIVVDINGKITKVNRATADLAGCTEQELVGKFASSLISDESEENIIQCLLALPFGESATRYEAEFTSGQGRKVPMLLSGGVIRNGVGTVEGAVIVAKDITDRKEAEAKVNAYANELQQTSDELKNFVYIASHDLRAPLVSIKGFTGEMKDNMLELSTFVRVVINHLPEEQGKRVQVLLDQEIPEALHFVGSSANQMNGHLEAILTLSRLGRKGLHPELVDTSAIVTKILDSEAHRIERHRVAVAVGELPPVVADTMAIEQILGNLIDNALKYLEPGRDGHIEITAEKGEWEALFRVRDNGRGIAADDMGKIFELFRRAGKQNTQGAGLGLAYVKTLVRRHGGRIWCESEPGVGTTFTFTISMRA